MSTELTLLLWSLALLAANIGVQSTLYRVQKGWWFALTARDSEAPHNKWTGRAGRALRNFLETYPAFVVLVVVVELAGRSDALTVWGAHIYFWARWVYLPLYLFGVPVVRSAVWTIGAAGLVLMFAGILL
jgi:uncharacterized MAPEG superfamily protein